MIQQNIITSVSILDSGILLVKRVETIEQRAETFMKPVEKYPLEVLRK